MNSKEKYTLLDKFDICHRCEKSKVFPGRKYCSVCLEKIAQENAKRYNSEKAKLYNPRRRELYQEHKLKGVCVRCKKKATHGLYCYECSIKVKKHNIETASRRKREREKRGLIPEIRKSQQLCLRCGKPLTTKNSRLCDVCCDENRKNSMLADKTLWRKAELQRYEKNKKWRKNKTLNLRSV